MRKLLVLPILLFVACSTAPPPAPPQPAAPAAPVGDQGFTVEEEARVLAMEDRREYDPALVAAWTKHPNVLHRVRMALALGHIGSQTFVDKDGDGEQSLGEPGAGVEELTTLTGDPDRRVREMAAFALGEIGDVTGASPLFYLTTDQDAGVAAEAVEALSKLAADKSFVRDHFQRYSQLTAENWPEGIRARAIRFLFRFDTDEASAIALDALASPSAAIRQEGAYTLARRAYAPAMASLHLLVTDPNVLTRCYAMTALGRIGAPVSSRFVFDALGDVHPWVRTNAAVALARIAEKTPSVIRAEDLPRIQALTEDPDPGVRASSVPLLGYYAAINETAKARLVSIAADGSSWLRELAHGTYAKQFGERASDPKQDWWSHLRILENLAAAPAGKIARRSYASYGVPMLRAAVAASMPDDRIDPEITVLEALLDDPDVVVRASAIERYGHNTGRPREQTVATLAAAEVRGRTDPMNDARAAAVAALSEIDYPQREVILRRLLTDNDPVIRRIAAEAIKEKALKKRPQYTPLAVQRTSDEYAEIVRWSRQPHTATIHMTRGNVQLALLTQDAPMTTWNFAQLARKKYFDNTTFMRVVPNFVAQGGDPRNDMSGGPGYSIRDEINLQKYTRGAVGMALSGPDTGGSQFFVTHSPQPHLDGGYTIFARVYDGMNAVVDQVERGDAVQTITIDEHPPVGQAELQSVPNVSLPLMIGEKNTAELLRILPEYVEARDQYKADITVVEMMKSYVQAGDRMEVYMGTWCSDSLREVPKFLRIVDDLKSQFGVDLPVRYIALDKSKQEPKALLVGKSIDKVATFIYYRGDQELGRIVERPVAVFEDDLLTVVAKPR
jgi:cyclophilin family peptidyl-prolyl cis-trans isomerase/HEAT repeat protein/thiol-disulfide isomerase/thioredoxin